MFRVIGRLLGIHDNIYAAARCVCVWHGKWEMNMIT